jgi:hypothetical protein
LILGNLRVPIKQLIQRLPPEGLPIRTDEHSWQRIEKDISEHSDATFTHSLCPECAREHYPEEFAQLQRENAVRPPRHYSLEHMRSEAVCGLRSAFGGFGHRSWKRDSRR